MSTKICENWECRHSKFSRMASISRKKFHYCKHNILHNNVSLAEVAGISVSVWILPVDRISDGFVELMMGSRF